MGDRERGGDRYLCACMGIKECGRLLVSVYGRERVREVSVYGRQRERGECVWETERER